MKKCSFIAIWLVIFFVWSFSATSQPLLDLPDFLKIAGGSQIRYRFDALKSPVGSTHDASRINYSYYRLKDSLGRKEVVPFDVLPEVKELYDLGWEAIELEEPDTALAIFEEAITMDPNFSPAYTGKGYTLNLLGKPFDAIEACSVATAHNPIDYIAYWTAATAWDKLNNPDSALDAICHAWILNRNHPEIIRDVKRFAEKGGMVLDNWVFTPQYSVLLNEGEVVVSYWKPWMGYAVCKAVWQYEPGFVPGRNIKGDEDYFRERECLSCLLTSMNTFQKEANADPGLNGFKAAMGNKMASEFILFEIFLPEMPDMAYYLDPRRIASVKQYILSMKLK
ncbi:MAG TPA: tetratricopeptide repeat protein [Bacteroidales bacterium]|nr:tetratricopeptide repeat protein [Bacteroidales bacterium]HRZ49402.1 tetratricopeptide repeat protein [Bacteroidales bacterium]